MLGYIISENDDIIIEEHEIFSFDILRKTDLNIFVVEHNKIWYMNDIIFHATKYGHVQVLEWYKNSGYKFNDCFIENAAYFNKINVLEWFKHNDMTNSDNIQNAIHATMRGGNINVLEWFKNSGYELKFDKYCFYYATVYGNVNLLEWFKNRGYVMKYDKGAIRYNYYNKVIYFIIKIIHIKKIILWVDYGKIRKIVKFKTKNNYIKGYNKN